MKRGITKVKTILMSIRAEHNGNIEKGLKKSELRTKAPKIDTPFKVLTYESGVNGRHKVVNEWICKDITSWLMYMGLPAHLSKVACVPNEYIWEYCNRGHKNIDEMHITDLVIYDTPKDLTEFYCEKTINCFTTEHNIEGIVHYPKKKKVIEQIKKPPQSWCYVIEKEKNT